LYAVELEGIDKTFPGGVQANKNITLQIREGEVYGLLGENGAGKSTLMNILYGLLSQDAGRIVIKGEEVDLKSPEDAIKRGVGMVHQHYKLIPPLTVTENVLLGLELPSKRMDRGTAFSLFLSSLLVLFVLYRILPLTDFLYILLAYAAVLVLFLLVIPRYKGLGPRFSGAMDKLGPVGRLLRSGGTTLRGYRSIGFEDAAKRISEIAEENGLDIDPYAKVQDISVGIQQRVEIIKALYREAEILILDEPTSVLTPQEVDELFVTLEKFKETGKTIILITHKLREPMILCDRISVLRDGELVGTVNKEDTSREELAHMMVGRQVVFRVEKPPASAGESVMSTNRLMVRDDRGILKVNDISFDVHKGEILGIAGVEGNGQTELVEAIVGLRGVDSGRILVEGADVTIQRPSAFSDEAQELGLGMKIRAFFQRNWSRIAAIRYWRRGFGPERVRDAGVAHIPEDRHHRGLILRFTVEENLIIGRHDEPPFAEGLRNSLLKLDEWESLSKDLIDRYSIKVPDMDNLAITLSGGNQQKMIVAREIATNPKVLIAAQPTRGLDVGATEFIHETLIEMRDKGVGILLVSAELDEIQSLSDRIAVIFEGKIVGFRDPAETDARELGLLMAGQSDDSQALEGLQ
jgi:simple sugar transport system ATP-binding protein